MSSNLMKSMFICVAVVFYSACTVSDSEMTKLMRQEGIKNYKFTGYSPFSCSKDDSLSTGFTGEKNGQPVKGVVCGGLLFKAYTIRYQ